MLTDIELGYLAGIIDGEGCINMATARRNSGKTDTFARVAVEMTDPQVIEWLANLFGGYVIRARDRGVGRKPTYRWQLTKSADILSFCRMIEPHLKVKGPQARKVIELYEGSLKKGFFVDDNERSRRDSIRTELMTLNQRGR